MTGLIRAELLTFVPDPFYRLIWPCIKQEVKDDDYGEFHLEHPLCWQIHANVENAWNEEEVWRVEMYVSFGIMSLGLLSLLAITSIPSVHSMLNWREFSFIQVQTYTTGVPKV